MLFASDVLWVHNLLCSFLLAWECNICSLWLAKIIHVIYVTRPVETQCSNRFIQEYAKESEIMDVIRKKENNRKWYVKHKAECRKRNKKYYEKNKERLLAKNKQWAIDHKEQRAVSAKVWVHKNREKYLQYHKEYSKNNRERFNRHARQWKLDNREYYLKQRKEYYDSLKSQFFDMLGGAKCVYCGCDRFEILEVNHVDGVRNWLLANGVSGALNMTRKLILRSYGRALMTDVLKGRRSAEGLEVTCRVCNAAHYVLNEYGVKFNINYIDNNILVTETK